MRCPACHAEMSEPVERVEPIILEAEMLALIDHGDELAAAERYRRATGADLKRTQAAVDALKASRSLAVEQPGAQEVEWRERLVKSCDLAELYRYLGMPRQGDMTSPEE
jgi:hypothetical protein